MTSSAQPSPDTAETVAGLNDAFRRGDKATMAALVDDNCVMLSAQPAPDGTASGAGAVGPGLFR